MRDAALDGAALDDRALRTLDVGAGTGFTTEGIVARVDSANVTMLDQSPHQLARAAGKPALDGCTLFGYPVDDPQRYGVVELTDDGSVLSIVEGGKLGVVLIDGGLHPQLAGRVELVGGHAVAIDSPPQHLI